MNPTYTKDEVIKHLRAGCMRRVNNDADWVAITLDLAQWLGRGRGLYPNDADFGEWLNAEFIPISKDDRAGLLRIDAAARDDRDAVYDRLSEAETRSWETAGKMFPPAGRFRIDPNPRELPLESPQSPSEVGISAKSASPEPTKKSPRPTSNLGPTPKLEEKFGKDGLTIWEWLRAAGSHSRQVMVREALCDEAKPATIRRLAAFISSNRDLPPPWISTKVLTARFFWREMPTTLMNRTHGPRQGDGALNLTMEKWDEAIAPVYAAWLAAGKPRNAEAWFKSQDKRPDAVVVPLLAMPRPPVPTSVAHPSPVEKYDPIFAPAREGPIRAYGGEIWPAPLGRWTFGQAWYAFQLWRILDPIFARSEPNPRTRARTLMNPYMPSLRGLNPGAGEAFNAILTAQHDHPEKAEETEAPSYRLRVAG